jgi:ubiquinone/menaquinone biosynthesis C-methylase UbiE
MPFDPTTLLLPAADQSSATVKACCSLLYQHEWLPLLLGDSFHPGKLALTRRLGEMIGLKSGDRVLDVASGPGTTALFLAREFGVEIVGVDLAPDLVERANALAHEAGLQAQVRFELGDAEALPFEAASFDAILCECAFCTFPDKATAAAEFARVLRPGGRVGISDITKSAALPDELETLMAWVACVADARPVADYVEILQTAGIAVPDVERHDKALAELIDEIRGKLLGVELMVKLKKLDLPLEIDFDEAGRLAQMAAQEVRRGHLGYALLGGTRQI